jgi:hypothetical protein
MDQALWGCETDVRAVCYMLSGLAQAVTHVFAVITMAIAWWFMRRGKAAPPPVQTAAVVVDMTG